MQYLAQWRMQLAATLLSSTSMSLAEVAERVGYGSETALSRAYKRWLGVVSRGLGARQARRDRRRAERDQRAQAGGLRLDGRRDHSAMAAPYSPMSLGTSR